MTTNDVRPGGRGPVEDLPEHALGAAAAVDLGGVEPAQASLVRATDRRLRAGLVLGRPAPEAPETKAQRRVSPSSPRPGGSCRSARPPSGRGLGRVPVSSSSPGRVSRSSWYGLLPDAMVDPVDPLLQLRGFDLCLANDVGGGAAAEPRVGEPSAGLREEPREELPLPLEGGGAAGRPGGSLEKALADRWRPGSRCSEAAGPPRPGTSACRPEPSARPSPSRRRGRAPPRDPPDGSRPRPFEEPARAPPRGCS